MAAELRPLGVLCNLGCTYCYQEPMRIAGSIHTKYNLDLMLKEAESTNQVFTLFGGEPLLVPKVDLEIIFKRSMELYGYSGIQTNGTLIDDDHIALFKKYNVGVGVSIDGPDELNQLREVRGKRNQTLAATNQILINIQKMRKEGLGVSVIITLHRLNAAEGTIQRLIDFISYLGSIGVVNGNIHTLEVEANMPEQEKNVLTQEENIRVMLKLAQFFENHTHLTYNPFVDMRRGMEGDDSSTNCIWNNCDTMNTQAVYGIEGDGSSSNCGRTNKEGIDWYKAGDNGMERYISLYHSPQDLGGCNGCRFFMLCGGSCPGEALDGDFRNKTSYCEMNKAMLTYYEQQIEGEGKLPFTKRHDLKQMESIMLDRFMNGHGFKVDDISKYLHGQQSNSCSYMNAVANGDIRMIEVIQT